MNVFVTDYMLANVAMNDTTASEKPIEDICLERNITGVLGLSVIPILAVVVNLIVLIAVVLYRTRLQQNNVYIYVNSTLVSNFVFGILSTYQIFNHYYQFEGNPTSRDSPVHGWYVFRKAFLVAMYLVMISNIGTLIYAIRAGNYVIAKVTSAHDLASGGTSLNTPQFQRRKAYVLITLAWILPLILASLSLIESECSLACQCLTGCYPVSELQITQTRACSRVLTPMNNIYMGTVVLIWSLEITILFIMIFKTLGHSVVLTTDILRSRLSRRRKVQVNESTTKQNERKKTRKTSTKLKASENPVVDILKKQKETKTPESSSPVHDTDLSSETPTVKVNDNVTEETEQYAAVERNEDHNQDQGSAEQTMQRTKRQRRRYAKWLRTALKQLTFLTVLFFLCTAPAMIGVLIDMFRQTASPPFVNSVLTSLPIIYSIACPIILAKDLAGLKKALISFAVKLLPGTRVTHSATGTSSSVTTSDAEKGRKFIWMKNSRSQNN